MHSRVEEFHGQVQRQSPRVGQETLLLDKILASLQKPLAERCEDVRRMIEEFSIKDLHLLYPRLLASIFGFDFSKGWLLHSAKLRNLERVQHFLGPQGCLWKLVEKLEKDTFLRYEFPVTCLPKPTQLLLVQGVIPTLYRDKVQFTGGNQKLLVLNLGALEYFLFQFSYFITQSSSQLDGRMSEQSFETLYTALFSDYLEHFLPTNTPLTRCPGLHPQTGAKRYYNNTPGGEPPLCSSTPFSGLIKSFENKPFSSYAPTFDQSSSQVRQSETFLQILVEVWLNHPVDMEGENSSFGQDYFLPSVDHVRVVRMLVKHLHLFMNVNMNNIAMVASSEINENLYRTFMPETIKIVKKRLYWFIRHCFAHWPLDPTFRYILETWLSYIQPWRYVAPERCPTHNAHEILSLNWKPFINHNLLFYTILLQEFLNRTEKLNLRSVKDSQMLYRVTKVFSQQNLMVIVNEVERELVSCLSSVQQVQSTSQWSRSPKSSHYSHFTELQIPGTIYRPLFLEETRSNIRHLVCHVENILQSLRQPQSRESQSVQNGGWLKIKIKYTLNWLQDVFSIDEHYWLIQDENRKVQEHLDQVCKQLKKLFQIQDDGRHDRTIPWTAEVGNTSISHVAPRVDSVETQPDCVQTEQGVVLTALGKYQMANGLRRFHIQYSGDPDLQPVRSYEVVFLVRALYKLSTILNDKFGPKLSHIYCSPSWPGSLARHLSPSVEHPRTLSPVKQDHFEASTTVVPKISLRYLASSKLWTQLFLLCFVMLFVFERPWSTVVLIMFILFLMFLRNIHAVQKRDDRQSRTN